MVVYSRKFAGYCAAWAFLISFSFATRAQAATFCVDDFGDGPAKAGDCSGSCDSTPDCSLRDAIQAANADPDSDTIILPAGTYTLSQVGDKEDANASGDLDVLQSIEIQGAGEEKTVLRWSQDLNNQDRDRILDITPSGLSNVTVKLTGLTLQDGEIFNESPATAEGGGAIRNFGQLSLEGVVIRENILSAPGKLGGSAAQGGGIENDGTLNVLHTLIEKNVGSDGGGGIANFGSATIEASTLSGNITYNTGGGIRSISTLTMSNCTLSGNHADSDAGGIYIDNLGSETVDLENLTVTQNVADEEKDGSGDGGGLVLTQGTLKLGNTLVVGNTDQGGETPDCMVFGGQTIQSLGNNLIGDGLACTGLTDGDQGNIVGMDASLVLSPTLGDNGGPTPTHALLLNSPAIDAGPADCGVDEDQRGVQRPQGAACDIGAYETSGRVLADPTKIDFPDTHVGASSTPQTLTLTNVGERDLEIKNFTLQSGLEIFSVEVDACSGKLLAPGSSCQIEVGFKPEKAEGYVDLLNINTDVSQLSESVDLMGNGVQTGGCSFSEFAASSDGGSSLLLIFSGVVALLGVRCFKGPS